MVGVPEALHATIRRGPKEKQLHQGHGREGGGRREGHATCVTQEGYKKKGGKGGGGGSRGGRNALLFLKANRKHSQSKKRFAEKNVEYLSSGP